MSDEDELPDRVAFDYIKSSQFRVIHVDGIWGGVTPRLNIFMGLWSERPVIPQHVVYQINQDRSVGDEIKEERVARDAMAVREMEAGIALDLGLAKAMVKWLNEKIKTVEELKTEVKPQDAGNQGAT